MLVARSSNSSPSDLVALQLPLTLREVEVLLVLFLVACRLCRMFPSLPEEIMDIPTTAATIAVLTLLLATATASHMLPMVKPHNPSQLYQCTMVDRPQLEVMEASDPSSHSNHTMVALLNLNQAPVVQPRLLFLVNH